MKQFILTLSALLLVICFPVSGQHRDSSLQDMIAGTKQMFSWEIQETPPNGYMMFLDIPYTLEKKQHNYISLTVAKKYGEERPAFISFTLPDTVDKDSGVLLLFSGLVFPGKAAEEKPDDRKFLLHFNEHHQNNHTLTSRLWKGFLYKNGGRDTVAIFQYFMEYKQLYILFYDHSEIERLAMPLSFFQKQYDGLLNIPTYSTGNLADTALSPEERRDKKIFDNGDIPTSWKASGITNPVRLKQFIKYFRYLTDHNQKERIAKLLVYPLKSVFPMCADSAEFVQNYNQVFGKHLKKVLDAVRLNELFHDRDGVWIGSGPNIGIRQSGYRYEIFVISNAAFFKKNRLPAPGLMNTE